jgi:hypothetical protein
VYLPVSCALERVPKKMEVEQTSSYQSHSEVALADGDEVGDMQNHVGRQMVQLTLVEDQEPHMKLCSGNPSPRLKKY